MTGPAGRPAAGPTAHAVVGALGVGALVYLAHPLAFDGILNTDRFAVGFLAVSGLVLSLVGGVAEGLAWRAEYRPLALGCLVAFALVALYPAGLMSGRWFASQLEPQSTAALGLALVAWVMTVALEYLVARTIART